MSKHRTWTVGVTGATGYAGGEVCRLLAGHPNLRLAGVHANSSAGRRLGELQPHLLPYADLEVRPSDADSLKGYDVVVLAEQVARMPRLIGTSVGVKLTLTSVPAACERFCTISGVCRWTPPTP